MGSTILDEEEEWLAGQEEVDLQAGLALLLVPLPVPLVDIEGDVMSLTPAFEREPSKILELMELDERIRLIDGCTSQAEYRYHMLRESVRLSMGRPRAWDLFGTSYIMRKEECRRVIAAGKRPKEVGMAQVTREVLKSSTIFPSTWKYLEESLAGIVFEARSMAGEELGF
ncbi:hypothetical protein ACLOJK_020012 [Asimina triloba]